MYSCTEGKKNIGSNLILVLNQGSNAHTHLTAETIQQSHWSHICIHSFIHRLTHTTLSVHTMTPVRFPTFEPYCITYALLMLFSKLKQIEKIRCGSRLCYWSFWYVGHTNVFPLRRLCTFTPQWHDQHWLTSWSSRNTFVTVSQVNKTVMMQESQDLHKENNMSIDHYHFAMNVLQ